MILAVFGLRALLCCLRSPQACERARCLASTHALVGPTLRARQEESLRFHTVKGQKQPFAQRHRLLSLPGGAFRLGSHPPLSCSRWCCDNNRTFSLLESAVFQFFSFSTSHLKTSNQTDSTDSLPLQPPLSARKSCGSEQTCAAAWGGARRGRSRCCWLPKRTTTDERNYFHDEVMSLNIRAFYVYLPMLISPYISTIPRFIFCWVHYTGAVVDLLVDKVISMYMERAATRPHSGG